MQQALLAIWRDLPQLLDPARFDAWSYRLLVRACYAEGRKKRHWAPNLRLLPDADPFQADASSRLADRDQLERFAVGAIETAQALVHHFPQGRADRRGALPAPGAVLVAQ